MWQRIGEATRRDGKHFTIFRQVIAGGREMFAATIFPRVPRTAGHPNLQAILNHNQLTGGPHIEKADFSRA